MKKILVALISIALTISISFNIYFVITNTKSNQSFLEGEYIGGKKYYNYSDDTEYITPKDSFDFSYLPTKNTLIFYKDGTMTYNPFRGTYTYSSKMKSLTFSFYRNNYEETYNFEVSNDLKKLTNTDKGKNQSTTNGELNPYYIEEYELK